MLRMLLRMRIFVCALHPAPIGAMHKASAQSMYMCVHVCTICMCILCVHIYIINHPTNRLQQKEATIQHQQNASTMQLLQIQNGVIYANGIRKFVRKTPLERWYL